MPNGVTQFLWATGQTVVGAPRSIVKACKYVTRYRVAPVVRVAAPKTALFSNCPSKSPNRIALTLEIRYNDANGDQVAFDGAATLHFDSSKISIYSLPQNGTAVTSGRDVKTHCNGANLYVQGLAAADSVTISLRLEATGWMSVATTEAFGTMAVREVKVEIFHEDGSSPAKKTALLGARQDRKFKAVGAPALTGGGYEWKKPGVNLKYLDKSQKRQTVVLGAVIRSSSVDDCRIGVVYKLRGQGACAEHKLTVVEVEIKDGDGTSDAKTKVLKGLRQKYKAVLTPAVGGGTYRWSAASAKISIAGGGSDQVVEVKGDAKTARKKSSKLKLTYTLNGQSVAKSVDVAVPELTVSPTLAAVAVDRTDGSTLELQAVGSPGSDHLKWTLADNDFEAEIDGGDSGKKLKLKAKKPGLVVATVTYKPEDTGVEAQGAAAFVSERVASLTVETAARKDLAETASADDKRAEVLLGLANDPARWKTGRVVAAAAGKPAEIDVLGLHDAGVHAWKAPTASFTRAADNQPTDHGTDRDKVLLAALPKGDGSGPPATPGYADDEVTVTYELHETEAADRLTVRAHRFGCSQVHWKRKGANNVTAADRIEICTHRASGHEQWHAHTDWLGADELRGAGISEPGGHQHGGRCHWCSGARDEYKKDPPRVIWHWLGPDAGVLVQARLLGDAIRTYVRLNTPNTKFATLLTPRMKTYISKKGGKMLGVLRGTKNGGTVWHYALSGFWRANGAWCEPINSLGSTSRTFTGYAGDAVTYNKAQAPFNTGAIPSGFGKMGRCAAPALLHKAKSEGITDLAVQEIWVDTRASPPSGSFTHKHEIGSCEQCRRILGAFLCEVGKRT